MSTANALPRHDTFQSDDTFSISLYVRNLDTADVAVAFRERSVKLTLPGATYDIEPLAHEIDPASSTYRVLKPKVELSLRKKHVGIKWDHLVGEEAELSMSAPHSKEETTPAVARQTKDWSKISTEALKEVETSDAPSDAKEAVRQLYASADPDVRRAMAKSFSESSGTTLSMDWKSTGSKRTEFVPPA